MGSREGIEKMRGRLIEQYGSVERYREVMKQRASTGGKASSGYKFAHGKVSAAEAGKLSNNSSWWKTEIERRKGGKE